MKRSSGKHAASAAVAVLLAAAGAARGAGNTPPAVPPAASAAASAGQKATQPSKAELLTVKVPLAVFVGHHVSVETSDTRRGRKPLANACVLDGKVDGSKIDVTLDFSKEGCADLRGSPPTGVTVSAQLGKDAYANFKLSPAADFTSAATSFELKTDGNVIKTALVAGAGKTILWSDGSDWHGVPLGSESKPKLPAALAEYLGTTDGSKRVYVNFGEKAGAREGHGQANLTLARPKMEKPQPPRNWCQRASGKFNGYTVCIDLYSAADDKRRRQVRVLPEGTNHILRPNRAMRVFVLHPKDSSISIELGGDEGIFVPADRNEVTKGGGELQAKSGEDVKPEPDFDIEQQEFAPRLPGTANLTVTIKREGQDEQRRVVEFLVEQTYLGAVRLGLAVVFGGAVDRGYEARAVSGSQQSEVVATSTQNANIELVLGYSAYLVPRSYASTNWLRFEPYVGIGVLNDSPTGIETLKSLHAGIEWEPTPNFAIALTGVARRVKRLQDGVHVGSPVSGNVPTADTIGLGAGVVFNLSPEFFRIAKSSGSSFFE